MILEILLCASAAKLDCTTMEVKLPAKTTLHQCMIVRKAFADDKGLLLPPELYPQKHKEFACK